jgi:2-C-methyl-D-erythritol 2,4-cyclodiphosphate synthase
MDYRTGIGYDIHLLVEDRKLFIGGIEIPYIKGLLGHSDADVLIHAVCDAILGAMAMGDIGELFPDTDPNYQDISSVELLKKVAQEIKSRGYSVSNLDTVVIAEEPNLSAFKKQIQKSLAGILNINEDRVGIKAKTNEGISAIGRKEAIASYAVALLATPT